MKYYIMLSLPVSRLISAVTYCHYATYAGTVNMGNICEQCTLYSVSLTTKICFQHGDSLFRRYSIKKRVDLS